MSAHRQTALSFASAVSNKRLEEVAAYLSEEFIWRPHPERLGGLGRPEGHSKSQFLELMRGLNNIKKWNFDTENPMKVIENDKSIVVHLHGNPEHVSGKIFSAEYVYMMDFDEQGKIKVLDEFFDTVYMEELARLG
ncbi:hypothetical protein L486_06665 [Kwoniella mangroviensis CBS 10435]|uniref:SnoaL-like domain-containing protein n=1 Tax=Kwoniella mangroviensis CBS 10435 TaxID=1331196 RepID=A0A1B9IJQ6_9TREE|nr:hypothetical protein L486_06665 [Kwoniella mangroviensis CBS 10435]